MRLKIVIIIVLIPFISCKHSSKKSATCDNEKVFISEDYYNKIHPEVEFFAKTYNFLPILPAISYDSLFSFHQIDSMYRYICQNNLTGLYGTIPLKYIYNSDTILLPAFPVYCGLVDIFYKNIMTIKVADSGIIFYHNETSLDINNPIIKDTLREIISRNLSAFFENLIELNEKERDTNQIKKKVMSKKIYPGWQFCFELQDDNQWRKINRPLDIILTSYLAGLKKSMKQNYKKEICELDPFELRLISGILYISFIFDKSRE